MSWKTPPKCSPSFSFLPMHYGFKKIKNKKGLNIEQVTEAFENLFLLQNRHICSNMQLLILITFANGYKPQPPLYNRILKSDYLNQKKEGVWVWVWVWEGRRKKIQIGNACPLQQIRPMCNKVHWGLSQGRQHQTLQMQTQMMMMMMAILLDKPSLSLSANNMSLVHRISACTFQEDKPI